ncbi:hypothetical protein JKF63_00210 [Porcisia hertigi]|uniref:GOLD domain-containing protein n=1 Tax=Porcisia hertigi TaxID=2761500 RepID=A0A836I4K5_9TRYP|nr:hypothetical protein JKF63_00210 [Porcisia hertigi]
MKSAFTEGACVPSLFRGCPWPILLLVLLLSVLLVITPADALTYHFVDGKPLCFSETIENVKKKQITGTYDWKASATSPASQVQLRLSVKDGSGNVYYDKEMMEGEHSFAVMPNNNVMSGEQLICFTPSSSFVTTEDRAVKVRIELDRELKEDVNRMKEVVEKLERRRQIDGLDVYTYQEAGGQLKDILQPRVYLEAVERALGVTERLLAHVADDLAVSADREGRMRSTSESTFTRVWVCALLLIGVITGVLWMQFHFLKSTLKKKKLL